MEEQYVRLKLIQGSQSIAIGDRYLRLMENGFVDEGQTVRLELRAYDPTGLGAVQKRLLDIAKFIAAAKEYEVTRRGNPVVLEASLNVDIDQTPSLGRAPVWKRIVDGRIIPAQNQWYILKGYDRCTVILETAPVRTSKGFTYAWRGQERMLPYAKGFVQPREDGGINIWPVAKNLHSNPVFGYTDSTGLEDFDYCWTTSGTGTLSENWDDHYILFDHRSAKIAATTDYILYETKTVTSGIKVLHGFYAYKDGSEITSADCQAYADGGQISNYEEVEGHPGWYRIWAITTTPDTSVNFGALVKAGKTVYVDGFFAIATPPLGADWWDVGWEERRQITISPATGNDIAAGDCVKLSISGTDASEIYSHCLATGDDLRIVHDNGAGTFTEKDRYLQTFTSSSIVIYFKCHENVTGGTSNTKHYIYYRNSAAPTPTLTNPFIYYRPLSSLSDFTQAGGTVWSVVGGVARCTPAVNSTKYNLLVTAPFDSLPSVYELAVEQRASRQGTQFDYNGPAVRNALTADYYEVGRWLGGTNKWQLINASAVLVESTADNNFDERNWHHYALKVTGGGGAALEVDHVQKITQASGWGGNATWKYLGISSWTDDVSGAPYFEFRNLWVRKRWATEPTVSIGAMVEQPTTDMPNDYPFFYGDTPYCQWLNVPHAGVSKAEGGVLKYRADQYIAAERGTIYIVWTAKWGYDRVGDITFFQVGSLRGYYDATNDRFKLTDGTNTAQSSVQSFGAGAQLCIAFTWDAGATNKLRIDLNGAIDGTAASFVPPTITAGTGLYIGSKSDATEQCGQINEIIISERGKVFTAAEVAALWAKGVGHGEIDYLWVWDGAGNLINHEDSAVHKNSFYIRHAGGDEEAGLQLLVDASDAAVDIADILISQRRNCPHWWVHWIESEDAEEYGTSGTVVQTASSEASNGYYELQTPADANWTEDRKFLYPIRDVDARDANRYYGTYDVWLRCWDESASVQFQIKVKPQMAYSDSYNYTQRWNDPVSPSAVGQWEMIYLGRVTFPPANASDFRAEHLNTWEAALDPFILVAQKVKRASGAAGIRLDAMMLLDGNAICRGQKIYYGWQVILMDTIAEVPYIGGLDYPVEGSRYIVHSPFKHIGHWLFAPTDAEAKYVICVFRDNNVHNIADEFSITAHVQSRYTKIVR